MATVVIDGDIIVYRLGFVLELEFDAIAAREQVNRYIKQIVEKSGADDFIIYLTDSKANFRNEVAVTHPYKGNRKNSKKPYWFKMIRKHLKEYWKAEECVGIEADDALAIYATNNENVIISSTDKDLKQVAGNHYDFVKDISYTISQKEGDYLFWCQMLTGDSTDNIHGIKGIGTKRAEKALKGKPSLKHIVEDMYKVHFGEDWEDRFKENHALLWMLRDLDNPYYILQSRPFKIAEIDEDFLFD
jgi:hypothetical protein